jgi:hypothetical protein
MFKITSGMYEFFLSMVQLIGLVGLESPREVNELISIEIMKKL